MAVLLKTRSYLGAFRLLKRPALAPGFTACAAAVSGRDRAPPQPRPPSPAVQTGEAAADWLAGAQLDGVSTRPASPDGSGCRPPTAAGGLSSLAASLRCRQLGMGLPRLRHELPDRLQHHDHLPGESPPARWRPGEPGFAQPGA